MDAYRDNLEHLRHELARIDLMLRRALIVTRVRMAGSDQDGFRGMVISENEIDSLSQTLDLLGDPWRAAESLQADLAPIEHQLATLRSEIDARIEATHAAGRVLRLPQLAHTFALSQAEVDILLLALAPELEPRYETLFAYLHNDVTRKRPSVDLCLNVICRSAEEKVFARRFFSDGAALLRFALVDLIEETYDRQPTLLRRFLKMRGNVAGMLIEQPPAAPEAGTWLELMPEAANDVAKVTRDQIRGLVTAELQPSSIIHLAGDHDDTLRATALLVASERGQPLLRVAAEDQKWDAGALAREARLRRAMILMTVDKPEAAAERAGELAPLLDTPLLVAGPAAIALPRSLPLWRVVVRPPEFATRLAAWNDALREAGIDADAPRLADAFRFPGTRIRQATALARTLAVLRDPAEPKPVMSDVLEAGRVLTAPRLARLAIPVEPRYGWEDLVLSDEKIRQLAGISARIQHRRRVHRDWGFGRKLARGKGVSVLFSGPSGTGKTMAAEVLARDLSIDLYQIDLAAVVSKYIGETEKNLDEIFRGAEEGQVLLFFDEADALFGKRTEVKDAHDRYANIEVDYLLQRMEQYSGPVVLATNFVKNLDEAFLRRLHDVVEFPFPDEAARERIWRTHFPEEAPRADDIDFEFLGKQFTLAGGHIRNIVVNAAFLAANEGSAIAMRHLLVALRGEYQKQGKLMMTSDLGVHAAALREGAR